MELPLPLLTLACLFCFATGALDRVGAKPSALFVFGDSYADTGNHNPYIPVLNRPWKLPYGSTWPGEGTGRYSDGKVFTDYFAAFLGLSTPMTYRKVQSTKAYEETMNGINFAYGGSGMFRTFGPLIPKISSQIEQFKDLIQSGFLSKELISSSFVLLVVCGNDYTAYGEQHENDEGIMDFVPNVTSEVDGTLKALYELGVRKFGVTNMAPYGCYPKVTSKNNYNSCDHTQHGRTVLHNKLLTQHILDLKKLFSDLEIMILDLQRAFEVVLHGEFAQDDYINEECNFRKSMSLRPCCDGKCGEKDYLGRHLYTICNSTKEFLFWDNVHPTQAGWEAISKVLFGPSPC